MLKLFQFKMKSPADIYYLEEKNVF